MLHLSWFGASLGIQSWGSKHLGTIAERMDSCEWRTIVPDVHVAGHTALET